MPGAFVDGWTNRPTSTPDVRWIWNSYAEFVGWGEETPAAAHRWIETMHWREGAEGRALLFAVFLGLLRDRIETAAASAPKEPARD